MQREAVSSSSLRSVGYDAGTRTLEIEFQNGRVYQYSEVLRSEFDALMQASSKGSYFNDEIKDCYPTQRVR